MRLSIYDQEIKPHLDFILAGSEMASRHARRLAAKPEFKTLAEYELQQAREALEAALQEVSDAEAQYQAKPLETA